MIPVENSVAGRVADIHHLMPDSGCTSSPSISCRCAPASRGQRRTLDDIKTVESHIHALGQCRKMIRQLGIKPVVAADTAGSAREIAEAGDKTAPRSPRGSPRKIYGLDILA